MKVLLALAFVSASAWAEEPPSPAPQAPPATEMQKVQFLSGEWVHKEVYHESPLGPAGEGAGHSKAAWLLGGHFLYFLYASHAPGGYREARGFLSFEEGKAEYRLDWFDSLGRTRTYRGRLQKPGDLRLLAEYSLSGSAVRETLSFLLRDDGTLLLTSEITSAGPSATPVSESLLSAARH